MIPEAMSLDDQLAKNITILAYLEKEVVEVRLQLGSILEQMKRDLKHGQYETALKRRGVGPRTALLWRRSFKKGDSHIGGDHLLAFRKHARKGKSINPYKNDEHIGVN